MTFPRTFRFRALATVALAAVLAAALPGALAARKAPKLPPIVFAMRARNSGAALAPGIGPAGRTRVTGGRLVVRERDGRFVPLLPDGRFYDVAHPSVSYDGRRIAFAAVTGRDAPWRIWTCSASGRDVAPVTADLPGPDLGARGAAFAERFARFDDFDPCWLPDGRIAFASTRWPLLSQSGERVSNVWLVGADGSGLARLTAERDGGEEPAVDPLTGRLLYARWAFNRWRAADNDAGLVAGFAGSLPADTVSLWQAGTIALDGSGLRLAGGDPRTRDGQMGYEPAVLDDSTFVGVAAERRDLVRGTRLGIWLYPRRFGFPRPLAGYGSGTGWSACSPLVLPDGRFVFSMDEAGTGNFDLFVCDADGRNREQLTGELESAEMDAAAIVPRALPATASAGAPAPRAALPVDSPAGMRAAPRAVFECADVFANAPVDAPFPSALAAVPGARLRLWASLPSPTGGDSLVMFAEAPVSTRGAVRVADVPADVPFFPQLVDAHGRVLRSANGPAHASSFMAARPGETLTCVGCHAGHSAMAVPAEPEWTNLAPGARATASTEQRGDPGAPAAVDRRTIGELSQVAWIADGDTSEWLRLEFPSPVEAREVVLYGARGRSKEGGPLTVKRGELVLFAAGRELRRVSLDRELSPDGTRVELGGTTLDAIEFRPLEVDGRFRGRRVAALGEIEVIARLAGE